METFKNERARDQSLSLSPDLESHNTKFESYYFIDFYSYSDCNLLFAPAFITERNGGTYISSFHTRPLATTPVPTFELVFVQTLFAKLFKRGKLLFNS